MSNVVQASDQVTIEPQRPWAVKRVVRATNAGRLALFAALAAGITLVSPLANADGWALAFLVVNLTWTIATAVRLGAKERRDAIVRVVVSSLAFLAFVPWLSIFISTALKGYKGLYPGYLFNDMRITSYARVERLRGEDRYRVRKKKPCARSCRPCLRFVDPYRLRSIP